MPKFTVAANNDRDPFKRRWLLSVDNLPPANWPLVSNFDGVSFIENHTQGELMSVNLNLPNGKHTVYFATSAPASGQYGTYSGGIQMDGIAGEFNSVDIDTVAAFEIEVKDNKAVKRLNQAAQDIPGAVTGKKMSAALNRVKAFTTKNSKWLIVGVGAAAGITTLTYFLMKRRNGRRL